jgi:tRNA nucleotidyltransferase (CCA-adding enzyme)
LTRELCARIKIPKDYRDLGVLVGQYHTHCHRIREMKAATILKTLEKMDAFRRTKRFDQFLIACEADAKGRTGKENDLYPQAEYFKSLQRAAASVDTKSFVEEGMKGGQIARILREKRLTAIQNAM